MRLLEQTSLPDPLLEAARPFGVSYLFPYQRLVISNVLEAGSTARATPEQDTASDVEAEAVRRQIVVLPTGAGKTLCFQLPAAILGGVTIVVYPLLSLMADQIRRAQAAGLRVGVLRGGMSREERAALWESVNNGLLQILLTNPEMLGQDSVLAGLSGSEIRHLVIDEAHCVSEWGQTFRSSYLQLGHAIRDLSPRVSTAFTATASPPVLDAVRHQLFGDEGAHLIQALPDRPNIGYSVLETPAKLYALRLLFSGAIEERFRRPTE